MGRGGEWFWVARGVGSLSLTAWEAQHLRATRTDGPWPVSWHDQAEASLLEVQTTRQGTCNDDEAGQEEDWRTSPRYKRGTQTAGEKARVGEGTRGVAIECTQEAMRCAEDEGRRG